MKTNVKINQRVQYGSSFSDSIISRLTDSITPRKKYLALGIGVAALILVFSGIVIIEFTTPHPPKIVDFEAAPLTIIPHKSSTLRWRTSGAIKVMLNGKKVPLEGEKKVNPSKTSNYKLTATNEDGLTVSDIVTIEVTTPPPTKKHRFRNSQKVGGRGISTFDLDKRRTDEGDEMVH